MEIARRRSRHSSTHHCQRTRTAAPRQSEPDRSGCTRPRLRLAMNRRAVCFSLIILAAAVLFYFENRPGYKSYFSDDDLNNLGWPTWTGIGTYLTGLITPKFYEFNFRPVGFLYYRIMGPAFHLNFLPYVLVLQALHVLHVVLLFLIARRLGLSAVAALAG